VSFEGGEIMRLALLIALLQEALDIVGPDAEVRTWTGSVSDLIVEEDVNLVTLVCLEPKEEES
jgi:hypothetical protein